MGSSRDRLLLAAERLMHESGYEAVGVAALCEAADVRKGSFYHWWPSKQALAVAMLEQSWERTRRRVYESSFVSGGPFTDQVDRYVELLVGTLRRHQRESGAVRGCPFGNFAAEVAGRDPVIAAQVAVVFGQMQGYLRRAMVEAIGRGELPDDLDVDEASRSVVVHMEGLMLWARSHDDPEAMWGLVGAVHRLVGVDATVGPGSTR